MILLNSGMCFSSTGKAGERGGYSRVAASVLWSLPGSKARVGFAFL